MDNETRAERSFAEWLEWAQAEREFTADEIENRRLAFLGGWNARESVNRQDAEDAES